MMTWMYLSSLIYPVIWLVLVGIAVWALVRWVNASIPDARHRDSNVSPPALSALETLRQRYARGEIDASTFAEMRANLEGTSAEARPIDGRSGGIRTPTPA